MAPANETMKAPAKLCINVTVNGESLLPSLRRIIDRAAPVKAAATPYITPRLNSLENGFVIRSTPIIPMITADHL